MTFTHDPKRWTISLYMRLHFNINFIDKDEDLLLNVHLTELAVNNVVVLGRDVGTV